MQYNHTDEICNGGGILCVPGVSFDQYKNNGIKWI